VRIAALANFDTGATAVYAHGVFTPLPTVPGALFTEYNGLNNIGQFVGAYCNSAECSGFIETKGAFTTVDDPAAGPGGSTTPEGINDWGQIVGSYCDSAGSCVGFLDTKGHFTNFEDPQASPGSTFPELINDVGQIFGNYSDSEGNFPSFLATPKILSFASLANDPLAAVPESSTWVMLFLGFAGLGWLTHLRRLKLTPA
jgi:uncharacterized membrane protein